MRMGKHFWGIKGIGKSLNYKTDIIKNMMRLGIRYGSTKMDISYKLMNMAICWNMIKSGIWSKKMKTKCRNKKIKDKWIMPVSLRIRRDKGKNSKQPSSLILKKNIKKCFSKIILEFYLMNSQSKTNKI